MRVDFDKLIEEAETTENWTMCKGDPNSSELQGVIASFGRWFARGANTKEALRLLRDAIEDDIEHLDKITFRS